MKKTIGALVLILLLVVALVPWYAGLRAEKELQAIIARMDTYPGYQLAWSDYQRGWFSTEATLSIGIEFPAWPTGDGEPVEWPALPLAINIEHGPLLRDAGTLGWYSWQLKLTEDQTAWLQEHVQAEADEQLYQAVGHMGLLGTVKHKDELQPFSMTDEDGAATLKVSGYTGTLTVDAQRRMSYTGAIKGIDLSAQDALLTLGSVTLSANGDLSRLDWDTFIYPSDFFMNVASLHAEGGGEGAVTMTNAVVEGAVEMPVEENWFNIIMSLTAGEITTPATKIENASMTVAYERISFAAYEAYINMMRAVAESPSVDYQQFFTPEVLQEFFANGPAFVLRNLSFSMPEGSFKGDFELALRDDVPLPAQLANPLMLVQALSLDANARMDRSLALHLAKQSARSKQMQAPMESDPGVDDSALEEQARTTLEMLTQQGIVVEEGEELKAALQFIDGQLLLNGNPMPLPLDLLLGGQMAPQQPTQPSAPQPSAPQSGAPQQPAQP